MNEETKHIEQLPAEEPIGQAMAAVATEEVLTDSLQPLLEEAEEGYTPVAVQPYTSPVAELPAAIKTLIRTVVRRPLAMLADRGTSAKLSIIDMIVQSFHYLKLMGATYRGVSLPASIRSLIDNDQYANQDGYAYDPKAVYYTLVNENTHTKGKSFLLLFYGYYNTMNLSGADAYLTSDGTYYTEDTTHTWAETEKNNRWVAYIFNESESVDFVIDTYSPSHIFVRGKFDKIRSTISNNGQGGNIEEIVVPDGNELGYFGSTYGEMWSANVILRNIKTIGRLFIAGTTRTQSFFFDGEDITAHLFANNNSSTIWFRSVVMPNIEILRYFWVNSNAGSLTQWWTPNLKEVRTNISHGNSSSVGLKYLPLPQVRTITSPVLACTYSVQVTHLLLPELDSATAICSGAETYSMDTLVYIYLGYYNTEITSSVVLAASNTGMTFANLGIIELKDGYCHNLALYGWKAANWLDTSEHLTQFLSNFRDYIADRLADRTGQTSLTLTLSQTVRDAIHAAETTYHIEDIIVNQKHWTLSPAPSA